MENLATSRTVRSAFVLLASILLMVAPAKLVNAQTLLNGGFESPFVASGYATGSGDNWTPTGTAVAIVGNVNSANPQTSYGAQYLRLYSNTTATDTQTINSGFIIGATYTLSLACADAARRGDELLMLSVSGGATASQSFSIPIDFDAGTTSHVIPFATYSFTFVPTTNAPVTITLAVGNTSNAGAQGLLIDNVVLSVPEPATWTMLGVGTFFLALLAHGRRRATS